MLYLVILLPFFLYPVLFTLIGSVGASQQEKLTTKKVTVLLDPAAESTPVYQMLAQDTNLRLQLQAFDRSALDTLKNTIGIVVPANFNDRLARQETAPLTILANRSDDALDVRQRILSRQLSTLNDQIRNQRLAEAGLSPDFVTPIPVESVDITPEEQQAGRLLGSFLPMMILLFIFIGCIYIAIDITAGEKERRTLQTLFTAPVRTREIIAGKFLAVASVGIVSAAMNLLSLLLAINIQAYLLDAEVNTFSLSIDPVGWAWLAVLVLLATLFLGALSLAIVLLANSYKEAQSYVSPLMMLVLIPAMLSAMPGMELTAQTALVPMFNISLAIAGIFKATIEPAMLGLVAGVSLGYGLLALYLASLTFGNENIITGQKVDLKSLFKR
jgi:sodium transport system permease protein